MAADPVRAALYQRLSGDATLSAIATGGVHHRKATNPDGAPADPPYVIFNAMDPAREVWTFGEGSQRAIWLVKGVCRGRSATKAEEIDARCRALLHKVQIEVPGGHLSVLRESAIDYGDEGDGDPWHHVGSLYRLFHP